MRQQTWALLVVALAVAIAASVLWFVNVYDTAAGRCSRGDLGACTVIAAKQAAAQQAAEAQQQAAYVQRQTDALAAEPAREQLGLCYVRLAGRDATIRLAGEGATATCQAFVGIVIAGESSWGTAAVPGASRIVCALPYGGIAGNELTLTVLDSGGAYYGGLACHELLSGGD